MNITNSVNQQHIKFSPNMTVQKQNNISYGHSNVSFRGANSEQMLKLVEQQVDSLMDGSHLNILARNKFAKLLKKALPDIMSEENFINKGRDSKVYRIGDKYIAKIRRGYYEDNAIKFYHPVTFPNQKFKDLSVYYGSPVVRVGHVEILKNATPDSKSICAGVKYCGRDNAPSAEAIEEYEEKFLPLCASLPQESYDELAFNLKKLNRKRGLGFTQKTKFDEQGRESNTYRFGIVHYVPDYENPNNWIISEGKFKIVDDIRTMDCKEPNSLYTMLQPLLIRLTPYENHSIASYKPELTAIRGEIYNKCLIAAQKAKLPATSSAQHRDAEWYLGDLLRM